MSFSPFPGPTAPQNNPIPQPDWFQPSRFTISAITRGATTTVTVLPALFENQNPINMDYVVGQQVRFIIPQPYGIRQLNEVDAFVVDITGLNQFVVNVNSLLNFNDFIPSPPFGPTVPHVVPIGDVNSGTINSAGRASTGLFPPGTFINISPAAGG